MLHPVITPITTKRNTKQIEITQPLYKFDKVCSHLGSNQGPSDYESDALTG